MASIGIDLGTTNSVGAYFDGREVRILTSTPNGLVPSVVAYRKPRPPDEQEGTMLVGQAAYNYGYRDPENTVYSIKRLMGRTYDDPKVVEISERVNYKITKASDNADAGVRVQLAGKEMTPVEISALILKQIKDNVARALGQDVTHAVITVPAYFEESQRAATRDAGQRAGLIVKKIIDEPSSAAIAYGITVSRGERRRMLVYDLGGGTFDVSIILTTMDPKGRNHFEVLDYRGNNWLGGDDFDREIVGEMITWIKQTYSCDPSGDKAFHLLAKQAAEQAKITLTDANVADITRPAVYKATDGTVVDLDMQITRHRFEELIRPYVESTMDHVQRSLISQGFKPEDMSNVLMVGGSTLVPLVYRSVTGLFGQTRVQQVMNPYHSVAMGAAILANSLQGVACPNSKCNHVNDDAVENCTNCGEPLTAAVPTSDTISVTERTPFSFGIQAIRGSNPDAFEVIIPKGEIYPFSRPKTKDFYVTANNFVRAPFFSGDDPIASKNMHQGEIVLTEQDCREAGVDLSINSRVEVSFNLDHNRLFQFILKVPGTNLKKKLIVNPDLRSVNPPAQPAEDWNAHLKAVIDGADFLLGKYGSFMEQHTQQRLVRNIEEGRAALASDSVKVWQDAYQKLVIAIDGCGLASTLYQAECLKETAAIDRAKKIGEVIDAIKDNWHQGDRQAVERLMTPLRMAMAAENNIIRERRSHGDAKPTGILSVTGGANVSD
jgi:molecular chaperone DnaK